MPSFIGHCACAKILLKRLNLNEEDTIKFIIGNLVPDVRQVEIDYSKDEFINKINIQRSKRITHFRKKSNKILEYPNCNKFIKKYKDKIEEHVETLAYLFHLYTDYCYFKDFLPKTVTFLDEDHNSIIDRKNLSLVKINKNDKKVHPKYFFSKIDKQGLYKEYNRSNYLFINKFNLNIDTKVLRDYLANNKFNTYVDEIDKEQIDEILHKIDIILENVNSSEELLIFEEDKLEQFVYDTVDSFIKEYGYLLKKYLLTVIE